MTTSPRPTARHRSTTRFALLGIALPLTGLGAFGGAIALAEDPPAGNLTRNPSFETDPSVEWEGFRSGFNQVALPGEAPSGTYGVAVIAGPTADALEGFSIDDRRASGGTDVPAGTQFVASAFMRAANPQSLGKLGKVWVRERADGSLALVDRVNTAVPLTGVFQKLTTPVYTVKRAGSEVDVYVAQNPAAPGDAFIADLVTLNRNLPPAGSITADRASASAGTRITFSSSGVADPEGGPITRAWDLDGDGAFSEGTGVTASREFSAAGAYVVRLSAADAFGATAVFPIPVVVSRTGDVSIGVGGGGTGAVIGAGGGGGGGTTRGGTRGRITLSARQLLINQRIGQAAIRRLNAVEAKLDGRPASTATAKKSASRVRLDARQMLINQRIYQAGVRRAAALEARLDGLPTPAVGTRKGGTVRLSVAQLVINQHIAQAAVRRANALQARVGL